MTIKFSNGFATENGVVIVYVAGENGIYSHSASEHISKGTGLSAGAYLDEPPVAKDGVVIVRDGDKWAYAEDHRGETVYSTTDGRAVEIVEVGELPADVTKQPRPTEYHRWSGEAWELTTAAEKQRLTDAKASKLSELNAAASSYIAVAAKTSDTPDFERATWTIQATEATAWHSDNSTPTPNLDRIAENRGVPVDILRQKAFEKAMAYETLTSTIAGQRQRYEDMIDAAASLEALVALTFEFVVG